MLIYIFTFAASWSGPEVHTVGLARNLVSRGHQVNIVELGIPLYSDHLAQENIHVLRAVGKNTVNIPMDQSNSMKWVRQLLHFPKAIGLLVKGNSGAGSLVWDCAARAMFGNYVTIEHMRAPALPVDCVDTSSSLWRRLELWRVRQKLHVWARSLAPYRIICVSDAIRKTLTEDYMFAPSKLVTVHNGVDSRCFCNNVEARSRARASWGVPTDAIVFGAVGRLSPMKRHRVTIELFGQLLHEFPDRNLWLVLVGDGPLRCDLEQLALTRNVKSRVVFPGFTDRTQDAIAGLDAFLMPSSDEGLPLALLEAMSCEKIVIATAVGGIPEILENPDLGFLVDPGDDRKMFEAMKMVVALDRERFVAMGKAARKHVANKFDAQTQFEKISKLLEALI